MRWSAMDVFPEPAAPWMIRAWDVSLRMMAFCSRWIDDVLHRVVGGTTQFLAEDLVLDAE